MSIDKDEIKKEVEKQQYIISKAEASLRIIRAACPHTETYEGNYSWRVGSIVPATICSSCGECIKLNIPTVQPM
jgi:hypothetical protein